QAAKGWSKTDERKMETTTYTPASAAGGGSGAGEFVFSAVWEGVLNKIYSTTRKHTFHFDRAKGAITSAEGEMTQDYGFHTKGTASAKLESDQTIPADEAAQMAKDFDVLFAAKDAYETKMGDIDRDPAQADALITDAKSV